MLQLTLRGRIMITNRRREIRPWAVLILIAVLWGAANCAWSQVTQAATRPTIVFMTDFGVVDDSVAICKGVMYSIAADARIVDLTHQVTPYSILDGARFLYGATPYYPAGRSEEHTSEPPVTSLSRMPSSA